MKVSLHTHRGSSSVEFVVIAAAVGVLLAAVTGLWGDSGTEVGHAVGARLVRAISRPHASTPHWKHHKQTAHRREYGDAAGLALRPIIPRQAAWERSRHWTYQHADKAAQVSATLCALCAEAGWRASWGASTQRATAGGLAADGIVDVNAALLAAHVDASARRRVGPARLYSHARASGLIGASASARAKVRLGTSEQHVDVGGSAVAGASVRAEHTASVHLAGIALRNTTGAEGWAGAGARARLKAGRKGSTVTWGWSFGGALGLGGEVDSSGSIDFGKVTRRTAARRALALARLSSSFTTMPLLVSLSPLADHT